MKQRPDLALRDLRKSLALPHPEALAPKTQRCGGPVLPRQGSVSPATARGSRVCGGPALDRQFGTADFFLILDAAEVDRETYRLYTES